MRCTVLVLVLPVVLAGCSASPGAPARPRLPGQSAFADGTCRTAAPDLLDLGRTIPRLGDDSTVAPDVQARLQKTQDRLFPVAQAAEPELAPMLSTLVERLGAVRLRAVGSTYETSLGEDLQTSFDEVVAACTSRP